MEIPCGFEIIRRAQNKFRPEFASKNFKFHYNAERILAFFQQKYNLHNFHTGLRGGEKRAMTTRNKFSVDAVGDLHQRETGEFLHKIIIEIYGHKGKKNKDKPCSRTVNTYFFRSQLYRV